MKKNIPLELLEKYSVNIPRYTSYPTALEWHENITDSDFQHANSLSNQKLSSMSLYFHLPFCESHCYFCGCNVVISKKKDITNDYISFLKKEIESKSCIINKNRLVEQVHLGGGTPTYFHPDELYDFFSCVKDNFNFSSNAELSIEVDPRVTTVKHLEILSKLGFTRISMGVQDFNLKVQEAVNRIQPFELTRDLIRCARTLGFNSINIDLIYGLPFQTEELFKKNINLVLDLNPDRIALFHYAHLPEILPHQKKYIDVESLPSSYEKIKIFQYALKALTDNGFEFIGLDHFARNTDELAIAKKNKTLHRNFQGYTTKQGCDLYGFGITSISNIQDSFFQNIKKINPYYDAISNKLPVLFRGLVLSDDDLVRKEIIMNILCHGTVDFCLISKKFNIDFLEYFSSELNSLDELIHDGLISLNSDKIQVLDLGVFFLRNIASVFDKYLKSSKDSPASRKIYSKSI